MIYKGEEKLMDKHVQIVAALNILFGAIFIFVGMVGCLYILGRGAMYAEPLQHMDRAMLAVIAACFFSCLGLPGIIGGIGLWNKKSWARLVLIIVAIFLLFGFPFGTALGIYTLWVMMKPETQQLFTAQPHPME
jgi:hypothetical protein